MYQDYLVSSSHIENRLKSLSAMSPERTSELQNEMAQLEAAKTEINSADEKVKELCVLLRNEVDSNSGSIGYDSGLPLIQLVLDYVMPPFLLIIIIITPVQLISYQYLVLIQVHIL